MTSLIKCLRSRQYPWLGWLSQRLRSYEVKCWVLMSFILMYEWKYEINCTGNLCLNSTQVNYCIQNIHVCRHLKQCKKLRWWIPTYHLLQGFFYSYIHEHLWLHNDYMKVCNITGDKPTFMHSYGTNGRLYMWKWTNNQGH